MRSGIFGAEEVLGLVEVAVRIISHLWTTPLKMSSAKVVLPTWRLPSNATAGLFAIASFNRYAILRLNRANTNFNFRITRLKDERNYPRLCVIP